MKNRIATLRLMERGSLRSQQSLDEICIVCTVYREAFIRLDSFWRRVGKRSSRMIPIHTVYHVTGYTLLVPKMQRI